MEGLWSSSLRAENISFQTDIQTDISSYRVASLPKKDRKFCAVGLIMGMAWHGMVAHYFSFKIISIISLQKIIPLICRKIGICKYTSVATLKENNRGGKVLNNCLFPTRGSCADFQLSLWISANSVGNINTAKSLQKSRK